MMSSDAELTYVAVFLRAKGWRTRQIAEQLQVSCHRVHRLLVTLTQAEEGPVCPTRAALTETLVATRSDDGD